MTWQDDAWRYYHEGHWYEVIPLDQVMDQVTTTAADEQAWLDFLAGFTWEDVP